MHLHDSVHSYGFGQANFDMQKCVTSVVLSTPVPLEDLVLDLN